MPRIFSQTIATFMVGIMALSPVLATAQVSGIQFNLLESSEIFENAVQDGIDGAVDQAAGAFDATNVFGDSDSNTTGDPLMDAAITFLGGAASTLLSCAISGFIGSMPAAGAATIANVAAVPTKDSVTQVNTTLTQSNTQQIQVKECMMDGIAIAMKEHLIRGLIRGLITYINTGFDGGPGYMQDKDALLANEQDQVFEAYINNPDNFSSLCSAWESDVRLALATQYASAVAGSQVTQLSASGTGTGNQVYTGGIASCTVQAEGYAGSNGEGTDYWSNFLAKTTTTGGNPVTTYMAVENDLAENIQSRIQDRIEEVQRNGGFFDVTYCNDGTAGYSEIPGVAVGSGTRDCKITTPGTVINHQLNNALGSDVRRLELADEFDELINALVGKLLEMVFSGKGLKGTTDQQPGEEESLVDQYYNSLDEEGVAQSFEALVVQLQRRDDSVDEYVDSREEMLSLLFGAREAVYDAYACYATKANTWEDTRTGEIIPIAQVQSVSPDNRVQLAYSAQINYNGQNITAYLLPEQANEHYRAYAELLEKIDDYIQQATAQIDNAESSRDEITQLIQLARIMNNAEEGEHIETALGNDAIVRLIAREFGETANAVTVALDDGSFVQIPRNITNRQILQVFSIQYERLTIYNSANIELQLQTVEGAVTDMIEGPQLVNGAGRAPGVLADIQQCQTFSNTLRRENAVSALEGQPESQTGQQGN